MCNVLIWVLKLNFYDFVKGQVGLSSNSQATFLCHRVSLLLKAKQCDVIHSVMAASCRNFIKKRSGSVWFP